MRSCHKSSAARQVRLAEAQQSQGEQDELEFQNSIRTVNRLQLVQRGSRGKGKEVEDKGRTWWGGNEGAGALGQSQTWNKEGRQDRLAGSRQARGQGVRQPGTHPMTPRAWGSRRQKAYARSQGLCLPCSSHAPCPAHTASLQSWWKDERHAGSSGTKARGSGCLGAMIKGASQVVLVVKIPSASAGDIRNTGSIPKSGKSPGEGHGDALQYSCLENPMNRGDWRITVRGVAKNRTQLMQLSTAHSIWSI